MKKYFQAPWQFKDLVLVVFSVACLGFITLLALKYFDVGRYFSTSGSLEIILIGFLLQWLIISIPLVFFTIRRRIKFTAENFGFKKIQLWTFIKEILKAYLLYIGISLIISAIVIYFDVQIPGYQVQENIIPLFGNDKLSLIIAGIVVVVIAPLFEELFFRGFLLRTLVDKLGLYFGSIVSAMIFALVHFPWQSIIPIFILGLIINSIVIRTKNIWPALGFHIFNNALVFVIEILILKDVISIEKLT